MRQYEAVIKVMEENGGYATLGFLYQNVLKAPGVGWKTKTPFASIRRIVQDGRFFFKIRPGLWALKSLEHKLPPDISAKAMASHKERESFNHSYYQGLIVEIGNLKKFGTTVPAQDKNRLYLNKKLGELVNCKEFYNFSFDHVVRRAKTIDVLWFNERKMPAYCFEVEHSTDIQNSLLKFVELQDFNSRFFIVADISRKRDFETKRSYTAFLPLSTRVEFLSYDKISDWHTKAHQLSILEEQSRLG